jgi:hypothetical protein
MRLYSAGVKDPICASISADVVLVASEAMTPLISASPVRPKR